MRVRVLLGSVLLSGFWHESMSKLIHLVDDDAAVRGLLRETLELLTYTVWDADGGEAALKLLARRRPDLLLADFAMPQMNGAQLAKAARAIWPGLPILFASGHADTAAIEAAVGPDAPILRKPFEMDVLARAISEAMAGPAT